MPIFKIVSGAQTGVDRAALDVALDLGFACGGWVPRGRLAEDGSVPHRYPVRETQSRGYAHRTVRNVQDSDATLILTRGAPTGGTALTQRHAHEARRPCLVVDLTADVSPLAVHAWLRERRVRVLNVAGPRESNAPGIYGEAAQFLRALLTLAD
ncbi:MAG: putative molybdenum carrier protein [Defluviicoccus sp.]